MYLREHFNKKLNNLEAKLKHVEYHVTRTNFEEARISLKQCHDHVEELKAALEREPITSNELNKTQ